VNAASMALALLRAVACAILLLAGPSGAHGALPPAATEDRWVEVRTARFRVYTNADAPVAARAARHLERLAEVLSSGTKGLRVDGGREVRLYVFRDLPSFKPYRPYGDDDEGGVAAGFHASGVDVEYIAFYASEHEWSMRFASHEYLHAVLARSLGVAGVGERGSRRVLQHVRDPTPERRDRQTHSRTPRLAA
jgi:hypothetical protein